MTRVPGSIPSAYAGKTLIGSGSFGNELLREHADVRQVPVALSEVEAVADDELVGNLEADPADRHVHLPPRRLRHQRHDLERGGLARLEVPDQVRKREARVDDVLDDED